MIQINIVQPTGCLENHNHDIIDAVAEKLSTALGSRTFFDLDGLERILTYEAFENRDVHVRRLFRIRDMWFEAEGRHGGQGRNGGVFNRYAGLQRFRSFKLKLTSPDTVSFIS